MDTIETLLTYVYLILTIYILFRILKYAYSKNVRYNKDRAKLELMSVILIGFGAVIGWYTLPFQDTEMFETIILLPAGMMIIGVFSLMSCWGHVSRQREREERIRYENGEHVYVHDRYPDRGEYHPHYGRNQRRRRDDDNFFDSIGRSFQSQGSQAHGRRRNGNNDYYTDGIEKQCRAQERRLLGKRR